MEFTDIEKTGYFDVKKTGKCLQLLHVFIFLFNDNLKPKTKVNESRLEREELFLMQLWYVLNPYGAISVEVRIIYTFLKLVYDPY